MRNLIAFSFIDMLEMASSHASLLVAKPLIAIVVIIVIVRFRTNQKLIVIIADTLTYNFVELFIILSLLFIARRYFPLFYC